MGFEADPSRAAEDDCLRSAYMRNLLLEPVPAPAIAREGQIPKVIVQYWHDANAIPADVGECLDSWLVCVKRFGFERRLFNDVTARKFITRELSRTHVAAFDRCAHPAMRSDYFRLCYIASCGGFYVDADEVYQGGDCRSWFADERLKIQPLCYDPLTDSMVEPDRYQLRDSASSNWIYYVNNNPLIAPAAHPVVGLALVRSTQLLLRDDVITDIQSTTGPGNLTASLVRHSLAAVSAGRERDFCLLSDWDAVSISQWPLGYRGDERNWRLWRSSGQGVGRSQ